MSASGELWMAEYEQIGDDYIADAQKIGEAEALDRVKRRLRALGLDPGEIDDHCAELAS